MIPFAINSTKEQDELIDKVHCETSGINLNGTFLCIRKPICQNGEDSDKYASLVLTGISCRGSPIVALGKDGDGDTIYGLNIHLNPNVVMGLGIALKEYMERFLTEKESLH